MIHRCCKISEDGIDCEIHGKPFASEEEKSLSLQVKHLLGILSAHGPSEPFPQEDEMAFLESKIIRETSTKEDDARYSVLKKISERYNRKHFQEWLLIMLCEYSHEILTLKGQI